MLEAPLVHELDDGHDYEFVQAAIKTNMTEGKPSSPPSRLRGPDPDFPHTAGIEALTSPDSTFYAFYDPGDLAGTLEHTLSQLDEYVTREGPFDVVMGFSAGAVTAALYMLRTERQGISLPFRAAVFLSSASSDAEKAHVGVRPGVDVIHAPTVHIWGAADEQAPRGGQNLVSICDPRLCRVLVHDGGHELPRKDFLIAAVHLIRRALTEAEPS